MNVSGWINDFSDLHARYAIGTLGPGERERYRSAREQCARLVTSLENRGLQPGQAPRQELRVRRALPVQIEFADRTERAVTVEVSAGGFGAFVGQAPARGQLARVTLRLSGTSPLSCHARVAGTQKIGTTTRASFEFVELDAVRKERIETFLFGAVLEGLRCERSVEAPRAAVG